MIRLFKKLSQSYLYNIRLRYKLLISHVLLILLPTIVLSVFLYTKLYDIILSDSILSEQALTAQTATAVENALFRVTQAAGTLARSESAQALFGENIPGTPSPELAGSLMQLVDSVTDGELITGVRFYADDSFSHLSGASEDALIAPLSSVTGTYWYGIFSSSQTEMLFCPGLYLSATDEEKRGGLACIQRLETAPSTEVYLAIYFSGEKLSSILSSNVQTDNAAFYILNSRDVIVTDSSSSLSGAYFMTNADLAELVGGAGQFSTRLFQKDNIYVGYYEIAETDWHLVAILSAASLIQAGNAVVFQLILFYALFFGLALAIALFLSQSIAGRIAALIHQMQSLHGERPVRIEEAPPAKDEIGSLLSTYNYMSDEINNLLDAQAKAAEELRLEEFKALQAQINPHFLYNSLDMISWMAKAGQTPEVVDAVRALSRFYKLTLSTKSSRSSVASELQHVSLYVQLQNMRFENRIFFDVSVPESLLDCELPKLIFQPIVENSILHGIMEKPDKAGTIVITAWLEDEDLLLLVSDDGVGMQPEQIETILTGEGESTRGGTNIGVYNTHIRLKLLYGERYGLSYESRPGQGTDVQIRVPALPKTKKY